MVLVPIVALIAGCIGLAGTSTPEASPTPGAYAPPGPPPTPRGPLTPLHGIPAIDPHGPGIPAFTAEDARRYVLSHPLPQNLTHDQPGTITRIDFLTNGEVDQLLHGAGIGLPDDYPLCFVQLRGDFVFLGPREATVTYPIGVEVFDARTGNLLLAGGLPHEPIATSSPVATPTSTARPTPTNTPTGPQCTQVAGGTDTLNVDLAYLNVETGAKTTTPAGAHLHWFLGPGGFAIEPVNGAALASKSGSSFDALTCDQIKGATYGPGALPAGTYVFLVKTPSGRYAKVQMTWNAGTDQAALRWITYQTP